MFELIDTEYFDLNVGIAPTIGLGAGVAYDNEDFKEKREFILGIVILCFFLTSHIRIPKNN